MSVRYHINDAGEANRCEAVEKECRFGTHADSADDARRLYEESQNNLAVGEPVRKAVSSADGEASESDAENTASEGSANTVEDIDGSLVQIYTIHPENVQKAIAAVEKANRKLERFGIEGRFIYEHHEVIVGSHEEDGLTKHEIAHEFYLNRPSLSYGEYIFTATVSEEDGGLITRVSPTEYLEGWAPDSMKCDHCGQARHRNKTYIVRGNEGLKQVGSTCVQPYLGISPQGLDMMHEEILTDEITGGSSSGGGGGGAGGYVQQWDTAEVLSIALAVSDGGETFVSRATAEMSEYDKNPTSVTVQNILNPPAGLREDGIRWRNEVLERAKSYRTSGRVEKLLEIATSLPNTTDYGRNLNVLGAGQSVKNQNIGMLVSVIAAENRIKRQAGEKTARQKYWEQFKPGHLAPVGEKVAGHKVKVVGHQVREVPDRYNYYGDGYTTKSQITMIDDEGHQIVWWASKEIDGVDIGDEIELTSGSVKKHDTFNNIDQTVLTRVKFKLFGKD